MIKKYIIFFMLFSLLSCGDISFVLSEGGKTNQYKDNVFLVFIGKTENTNAETQTTNSTPSLKD